MALSFCEESGIDLLPVGRSADLEYAANILLLSKDPGKLQAFLDSLSASVSMFGMRFAPSKCKMLLQDWIGPAPSLTLTGEVVEGVFLWHNIDEYYVGEKPEKEVTFSNLNDNISYKNLEEMCKPFGVIEEAKIYYHPKTQRHLGIGTVVFQSSRCAKACAEALHQTSKMGNIMDVQVDFLGANRLRLLAQQMADLLPHDATAHHKSSMRSCSAIGYQHFDHRELRTPHSQTSMLQIPRSCASHQKTERARSSSLRDLPPSHCMTTFNSHLFGGPSVPGSELVADQKDGSCEKNVPIEHPGSTDRLRAPLLKTPSKPLDYVEITMITQDLFTLFVDELKEIMHRDVTRRIVEGKAFKIFSSWWDSTEEPLKTLDPRFTTTGKSESIGLVGDHNVPPHDDKNVPPDSQIVATNNTALTGAVYSAPSMPHPTTTSSYFTSGSSATVSGGDALQAGFNMFGFGMFSGLHATLPKIRRKPRPPSPQNFDPEVRGPNYCGKTIQSDSEPDQDRHRNRHSVPHERQRSGGKGIPFHMDSSSGDDETKLALNRTNNRLAQRKQLCIISFGNMHTSS
ncbi:unnamed protein product [Echinostoma caproni]|uniref:RRM domain-containing protein n=1 Tax=Echinostoma caproni TaxID=27848 RepID=A0A183AYP8_9TREM|nr:unnamed protein product [Echinostoma caproni]